MELKWAIKIMAKDLGVLLIAPLMELKCAS